MYDNKNYYYYYYEISIVHKFKQALEIQYPHLSLQFSIIFCFINCDYQ